MHIIFQVSKVNILTNAGYKKHALKCIVFLPILIFLLTGCAYSPNKTSDIIDTGIPLINRYPDYTKSCNKARTVWDMQYFDNKIYIGSGDYDLNAGPVDIWCYNIASDEWICEKEKIPDEQIKRFCVINDKLIIPGTDPTEDWSLGNYYIYENNEWVKYRNIPDGVHNFCMTEFKNKIFAGIGSDTNSEVVAVSDDNGKTFRKIELMKENKPVNVDGCTFIRVYNLFVFKDKLYCFFTDKTKDSYVFDLYQYNEINDNFEFVSALPKEFVRSLDVKVVQPFKDKMLFINNNRLFISSDLKKYKEIKLFGAQSFGDIVIKGNSIYILGYSTLSDNTIRNHVFKSNNGITFHQLLYFDYEIPAYSFEYANNSFWFGMGDDANSNSGRILKVKY